MGSIGCGTAASARDQFANQLSVTRPVSTTIGGLWKISSLTCRAIPIPPVGVASPSRIATSTPPLSRAEITAGPVAHSTQVTRGTSGAGRRPIASLTRSRVSTSSLYTRTVMVGSAAASVTLAMLPTRG